MIPQYKVSVSLATQLDKTSMVESMRCVSVDDMSDVSDMSD